MSLLWKPQTERTIIKFIDKPSPAIAGWGRGFARDLFPPDNTSPKKDSIKGTSLFAFLDCNRTISASMTVEAAAVLPLLIFFFLNLISAIEMIRLHGNLELALWETGRRMGVYGYAYDQVLSVQEEREEGKTPIWAEGLSGLVLNNIYARHEVIHYVGREYLDYSPLTYGSDGLNFLESRFMEDDCIDIRVTYQVSAWSPVPGFPSFRMANRYYGRAWTGYEIPVNEDSKSEDYVWVAVNGKVYHETYECSYLNKMIRTVSIAQIPLMRNNNGEIYTQCWLCREEPGSFEVYLTQDGSRYHNRFDCSSLKRTIFTVLRMDAITKYRPCSRCG